MTPDDLPRPDLSEADRAALARMHAVEPVWRGLVLARDGLAFPGRTILHAGPPVDLADLARPILNSAVMAALFEGWARDAADAEARILSGDIRLAPAQDHGAMVPLAAVLSPNMMAHRVVDRRDPARAVLAPLNGGMARAQRLGLAGPDILQHLRWINGDLAATLAIVADRDVPLLPVADQALTEGDDCHGRTMAGTRLVIAAIADRLGMDTPERRFLDGAPGFFLTLWMAAVGCMAQAAQGPGTTLITAMGANGVTAGVKLGGAPDRWIMAPATPPDGALVEGARPEDRLGAIGDSALVDALGFGAMLTPHGPLPRERLLPRVHPSLPLSGARVGLPAATLVLPGAEMRVALGILDCTGRRGRIGGGLYAPAASLFSAALEALAPA
ncbi:DUF1116 domain-containing protein [Segnochrobactraceae bacterium EtOH-i3]